MSNEKVIAPVNLVNSVTSIPDIAEITEEKQLAVEPVLTVPEKPADNHCEFTGNIVTDVTPIAPEKPAYNNDKIDKIDSTNAGNHSPFMPHTCLRDVVIHENCEVGCAIELIMRMQKHYGIIHQTLETAEDYNENPEWFKTNIGKISRSLDHNLECQCGEKIDLHDQVKFTIKSLKNAEKTSGTSCSIQ